MTLEKQIELLKEWHERAEMYLPIMSSEDIDRFLRWLKDYKQLKDDYADLDNRLRTANTEIDRLQAVSSWIPCSEKLPEVDEPVLIYVPCNEEMAVVSLDYDKIGFSNDDCWYGLRTAPFWMYLPTPPDPAEKPCGGDDNAEI